MKFHLMSDIHLEFANLVLPGDPDGILLLAGDICVAKRPSDAVRFFELETAKYKKTYYIMGNHEHYGYGEWNNSPRVLKELVSGTNVQFLDKEWLNLDDNLVLWGGTLWTNMDNNNPIVIHTAKYGMNDYRMINRDGHVLYPADTMLEFDLALASLKNCVEANPGKKILVMSHMAPSSKSCHPRYGKDNPLNYAYYSDLDDFILDNQSIVAWVHGHTHASHNYTIGETRVMCNPRGYAPAQRPDQPENADFNINFTFEV
jgi:predicted phosphohydrolase